MEGRNMSRVKSQVIPTKGDEGTKVKGKRISPKMLWVVWRHI